MLSRPRLAVAPVLLARRDQKLTQAQCACEVCVIQLMELLPQRGFNFVTFGHLLSVIIPAGVKCGTGARYFGLYFVKNSTE